MAKTITTTIKWRNAVEELPERSCEVLVWRSSSNSVMFVQYSASHGRFNCCDFCSKELAARVAIAVDYLGGNKRMIHELKTLPEYFEAVRKGDKTFELRENDRDFKVGDYLALNEWDGEKYTGRTTLVEVIYILNPNEVMTCAGGYVIMGIKKKGII